ncbi:MAG: hypothetical protein AAF938_25925 [Myxococcota bacterium]
MRAATYLTPALVGLVAACGARTGLMAPDAEASDAGVDATPDVADISFDAPDLFDAADMFDASDMAEMPVDMFVPECPDSVRVAGREASIPVDTIWALDTSISMADDLERMRNNINVFWDALSGADIDSRTVFVAQGGYAPAPPAGFSGRFVAVEQRVGSTDALLQLLTAFDSYEPSLRPDAITHFVVVTDDNSRDFEWEDFREEMLELLGHDFIFHAVASERLPSTPLNPFGVCTHESGSAFRVGEEYYEMADATGGLTMSICNDDWSELFERLNERVAIRIPIPCSYRLPLPPPDGIIYDPEDITVLATEPGQPAPFVVPNVPDEGACGANGGWWFVDRSDRVQVCPTTCEDLEAREARVEIDLGCTVFSR